MQKETTQKTCKRCHAAFQCQPHNISDCQCSTVKLSCAASQFLKSTSYDCLCSNCLSAIQNMVIAHPNRLLPSPNQLQEGTHYYKNGPYFVFTELYHYLKGTCCGNNCRHCAYGHPHQISKHEQAAS